MRSAPTISSRPTLRVSSATSRDGCAAVPCDKPQAGALGSHRLVSWSVAGICPWRMRYSRLYLTCAGQGLAAIRAPAQSGSCTCGDNCGTTTAGIIDFDVGLLDARTRRFIVATPGPCSLKDRTTTSVARWLATSPHVVAGHPVSHRDQTTLVTFAVTGTGVFVVGPFQCPGD